MGNRVIRRTYNAGHVAVHHCFSPLTGNWVIRRITMKTINSIKKAGFSPLTGNWVIRRIEIEASQHLAQDVSVPLRGIG